VNFYFARDVSRFGNEMRGRREGFLGVKSRSEAFLRKPQKKFGTPRVSIVLK
jgi:hypothetical protein